MRETPKGLIPVMLTPFREDGTIDFDGLTKLTEWYLEAGASGLFANCLSSEMFELTDAERLAVVRHIVDVVGAAVPVVATATFGGPIHHQTDFIKQMYDTGIEAAIAITNMLAGESEGDDVFEHNVFQLLDATHGVPLGFYECPDPFKRVLSAGQLKRFADTGRVIYHKDTCLDIEQVTAKLQATQDIPSFGLYDAYMVHAVASLKAGSAGLSCIQANYFPELVVWLCRNYDNSACGEQVELVQQFFIDHMDVMHQVYPTAAKYFLQQRGIPISTFTRRDIGVFNGVVKRNMDVLHAHMQHLYRKLDYLTNNTVDR